MQRILWGDMELAYLVPEVVVNPTGIHSAARAADEGRLCYVGVPSRSYVGESASKAPPKPNMLFLVYVDSKQEIYHWRWAHQDPADPTRPDPGEAKLGENLI